VPTARPTATPAPDTAEPIPDTAGSAPAAATAPLGVADVQQVASLTAAPNRRHPFSAPIWSPVRESAKITCVRTNCRKADGSYFHGYWAIEFIGRRGAPVHAAGAGIFHVGARYASCSKTPGKMAEGTWGWVDHGGGLVTRYHHLDSITAREGQLVTPATMIGRMGHWGDMPPCTTDYLHFEVRYGGLKGTRINPGSLRACTPSGVVTMPQVWGVSSFDHLARGRNWTPKSSSSCVSAVWNRTPAAPPLSVRRLPSAAKLSWGSRPAGVTSVRVAYEVWSPSQRRYGVPRYATLSARSSTGTLRGLTNGRTYRVRVAFRNAYGFSAWSPARTVKPASAPAAPRAPRFLSSPTTDTVRYGWWKAVPNGSSVTRYVTAVRCYRDGRWRAWTTRTTGPRTYSYVHRGLSRYSLCQVRVRADNVMGKGAWSKTSTIRKSRR
jgi:hypothetical protein